MASERFTTAFFTITMEEAKHKREEYVPKDIPDYLRQVTATGRVVTGLSVSPSALDSLRGFVVTLMPVRYNSLLQTATYVFHLTTTAQTMQTCNPSLICEVTYCVDPLETANIFSRNLHRFERQLPTTITAAETGDASLGWQWDAETGAFFAMRHNVIVGLHGTCVQQSLGTIAKEFVHSIDTAKTATAYPTQKGLLSALPATLSPGARADFAATNDKFPPGEVYFSATNGSVNYDPLRAEQVYYRAGVPGPAIITAAHLHNGNAPEIFSTSLEVRA